MNCPDEDWRCVILQQHDVLQYQSGNLQEKFLTVRNETEKLCEPLEIEDCIIQTMDDVSPTKWHIAHVTWFFETFLLLPYLKNYQFFHPTFAHLFNSYYELAGTFHPRPERGLLSRPTFNEVLKYRTYVNENMQSLLTDMHHPEYDSIQLLATIGIHHEQQHQELMLTDIKHVFACNPLKPAYSNKILPVNENLVALAWDRYDAGVYDVGENYSSGFAYDNETPRHKAYINDFEIATRLVTNGEYLEFMLAGSYRQPQHWLSEGWKKVQQDSWGAPLYWEQHDKVWYYMTLNGLAPIDLNAPVCHVSYFEANAFASWANKRLPTEYEWEIASRDRDISSDKTRANLRDSGNLHPIAAKDKTDHQYFGDVWEWTQSAYSPYPGFKTAQGALGEYNGKFMCGQYVLRGGSCATPANHIRATYRNFFYPKDQWQFSGIRLAKDA